MSPRDLIPFLLVCLPPAAAQTPQYVGAGGCSGSNCHGGTSPAAETDSRILANEYSIWSVRDKHSKAYGVLGSERSKRMGEILKLGAPQSAQRCLACHALGSPAKSVSDGVACEACHGPAQKWLGPHTAANNPHSNNVALGMYDTKDISLRTKKCLECHLGSSEKAVDHELIAAGHPDLPFELDTFSAALPMHWRDPKPQAGNSLPHVRVWAVGQATALAEGMRLLATHASSAWPEFSDLECYQCHHDLRATSWRLERGYPGRKAGSLQVNLARQDVLRVLAAQAAAEQVGALESAVTRVSSLVSGRFTDGAAIAQAARAAEQQANALAARFAREDFNAASARAIAKALTADIWAIASHGVGSAEQATMALDSLGAAYTGNKAAFQDGMSKLYDYLEHPSAYHPSEFANQFRKTAGLLN
jgi:hypothetical protein